LHTLAACQVRIDIDDTDATWQAVTAAVHEAAVAGADVVVLPELACTGAAFRSIAEAAERAEDMDGPTAARLRRLSSELGIVLIYGFVERNPAGQRRSPGGNLPYPPGQRPYNSAAVIDHGEILAAYRKTHLWDTEKLIFDAGSEPAPVVSTSAGRIAVMVCYDLEFPEMARDVGMRGAQLIAVPANWPANPKPPGERPVEVAKAQTAAAANHVYVAVADRCGAERGVDWYGSSVICDVTGYPLAGPASGERTVLVAEVDLDAADDKRVGPHNDAFADRRLDLAWVSPRKP
jgi:predicted amidohydrolase